MVLHANLRYFNITTGLKLYYQHWFPDHPRALLLYVHDLGDHIGRHGNFVRYFVENGYAVGLYDQRGHGQSNGDLSADGLFAEFVNDLSCFIHFSRGALPKGIPIILVGQGVGAQFIINLLVPGHNSYHTGIVAPPGKIHGFITLGAFIEPPVDKLSLKGQLQEKIAHFHPGVTLPSFISPQYLSEDAALVRAYAKDPLIKKRITLRLRRQILDNTQVIMAMAYRIRTPALMLHGQNDKIAQASGTRDFFSRLPLFTNKLCIYENAWHELTAGELCGRTFSDMKDWLDETLKKGPSKEKQCTEPLFTAS